MSEIQSSPATIRQHMGWSLPRHRAEVSFEVDRDFDDAYEPTNPKHSLYTDRLEDAVESWS